MTDTDAENDGVDVTDALSEAVSVMLADWLALDDALGVSDIEADPDWDRVCVRDGVRVSVCVGDFDDVRVPLRVPLCVRLRVCVCVRVRVPVCEPDCVRLGVSVPVPDGDTVAEHESL